MLKIYFPRTCLSAYCLVTLIFANRELQRAPMFLQNVNITRAAARLTSTWLLTVEKKDKLPAIDDVMETDLTMRREYIQLGYFVCVWSVANNNCILYKQWLFLERTNLCVTFNITHWLHPNFPHQHAVRDTQSNTSCCSISEVFIRSSVFCKKRKKQNRSKCSQERKSRNVLQKYAQLENTGKV